MSLIPEWSIQGVLPPIRPGREAVHRDRTPYRSDIVGFVERFALTPARIELLKCFLEYRKAIHDIGIVTGFQWINGSFAEHIEIIGGRDPRDIDCVTFYAMPEGYTEETLYGKNPNLFEHSDVKSQFHVDSFYIDIAENLTQELIDDLTYWYSLWSHQRDTFAWKGFIQIEIDPAQDKKAYSLLEKLEAGLQP